MSPGDLINGSFELIGGFMLIANCFRLYRDKMVKGINSWATAFFMLWGYWNIYYYPSLDQWLSFISGLVIVAANTAWLGMMLHYRSLALLRPRA